MKFKELKGIPAATLLKKKWVPLYKAFPFIGEDDEMKVNANVDLLAISPEAAIEYYLAGMDPNDLLTKSAGNPVDVDLRLEEIRLTGHLVPFAVINVSSSDLKSKDLVDEGDCYCKNGIISITLNDKEVKVELLEKRIENCVIKTKDGTRVVSDLILSDK